MSGNETEVGKGIKASGVPREKFFLTTKLNNNDHKRPEEALFDSLQKLDTPYLDLCKHSTGLQLVVCTDRRLRAHALARSNDAGFVGRGQVSRLARYVEVHGEDL